MVAGAKEAEAKPAMATSRANMRMADFIFGNLSEFNMEREETLSRQESYRKFFDKSSYFTLITNRDEE